MGYKKMKKNLGFADFALASSMKHNRSLKNMEKLNQSIDWNRINTILLSHYTVGTSSQGADAYPPFLKAFIFHVSSSLNGNTSHIGVYSRATKFVCTNIVKAVLWS